MSKLAVFGGHKEVTTRLTEFNSIGAEEISAVTKVLKSGRLSGFVGSNEYGFLGGQFVREFESAWASFFNVKHAISLNSWTSGLTAIVAALGVEPGDEVIVPTWTMCASASAVLHSFAIPVFVDINEEDFNISLASIDAAITPRTKAIMVVDIFGQSADIWGVLELAKKHQLKVITDSAQSIGALHHSQFVGTLADIGGFSLNYHKHIHTGEGGVVVTNDSSLAERVQLLRNHAEAVVSDRPMSNLSNLVGHNYRMCEIEAAIGICQLSKLSDILKRRYSQVQKLLNGLRDLPGLKIPEINPGNTHVFYIIGMVLDLDKLDIGRSVIVKALRAEGVQGLIEGYINVHMLPMYQKKIAYGGKGFPWNSPVYSGSVEYHEGICPIAERLHKETFVGFKICLFDLNETEIGQITGAFHKVWANLDLLRKEG